MTRNSRQTILTISRIKQAFKMNYKVFFIIFQKLLWRQIKQIYLGGEIPTFIDIVLKMSINKQINLRFMDYFRGNNT